MDERTQVYTIFTCEYTTASCGLRIFFVQVQDWCPKWRIIYFNNLFLEWISRINNDETNVVNTMQESSRYKL